MNPEAQRFIKGELEDCDTCWNVIPPINMFKKCAIAKGKKICTFNCNGAENSGIYSPNLIASSFNLECRCPRIQGNRTCGWYNSKLENISQEMVSGFTCQPGIV